MKRNHRFPEIPSFAVLRFKMGLLLLTGINWIPPVTMVCHSGGDTRTLGVTWYFRSGQ